MRSGLDDMMAILTYAAGATGIIATIVLGGLLIHSAIKGDFKKERLENRKNLENVITYVADKDKNGISSDEWKSVYRDLKIPYDELNPKRLTNYHIVKYFLIKKDSLNNLSDSEEDFKSYEKKFLLK